MAETVNFVDQMVQAAEKKKAAEAMAASRADPPAERSEETKASEHSRRNRTAMPAVDDTPRKQFAVYLSSELRQRVMEEHARTEKKISDIISEALKMYFGM